jgi:ribose transport system permease protein
MNDRGTDTAGGSQSPEGRTAKASLTSLRARVGTVALPIVSLVVLVIYFGIRNPAFLSTASADNILRQLAFLAVLSLAGTMVILIGGIDLSVASNATLGAILVALWVDKLGAPIAIILTVVLCAFVGLANGVGTTLLRVPSFLVTLGMLYVCDGISNTISTGRPVLFKSKVLGELVNGKTIPIIPNGALIALVLIGLLTLIAFNTQFGRHLYAVGSNERAARLAGVRVTYVKLAVFMLAGALAGIAGVLFTGRASTGVPLGANVYLLDSVAAVVVGGTALSGGVGGPHRTLLGAMVIVVLSIGLNITGVDPFVQSMIKGIVVIGAVALTIDRRRYGTIK